MLTDAEHAATHNANDNRKIEVMKGLLFLHSYKGRIHVDTRGDVRISRENALPVETITYKKKHLKRSNDGAFTSQNMVFQYTIWLKSTV